MILRIYPAPPNNHMGHAALAGKDYICALGKRGIIPAQKKRECDRATPGGLYPFRKLYYRPDRLKRPVTALPITKMQKSDGWCDQPDDPKYNNLVMLPYKSSAEPFWQKDDIYDLLIVVGHNDRPARHDFGSAVFLHLARPGFGPTRGCIAFERPDLLEILSLLTSESVVRIHLATRPY